MNSEIINNLVASMQRRMAALPHRMRPFTTEYGKLPTSFMLTGSRGCGKSTFMLHHSKGKRMLYFSADNPKVMTFNLYDFVSYVFMNGYEGVIIDEIHYANNWSIHLKALYDDFPGKQLWVSDSSSLVLRSGGADLSRRFVPIRMPLMSFREFLFLQTGTLYPTYKLGDSVLPVEPSSEILSQFALYRQMGSRPFYSEGDFEARYMAIMDKVFNNDIPFFLPSINENNLRLMRAIVGSLASSSIPRVQVSSLCADWGVGAEKLYQILFVMENVGILKIVRYQNDNKARSTGAKMLFDDPCAYPVLKADEGTSREAYVVFCLSNAAYDIYAMRDETKGDYIAIKEGNAINIEVGGKSKKPKASDYVARDNTDYPAGNAIPFWLLGMMW
ncbi:MAG: AAA family ATPase [Bacteroidales bacterium]|nr:AAA family ATPase [Bacteroidales bacterium]